MALDFNSEGILNPAKCKTCGLPVKGYVHGRTGEDTWQHDLFANGLDYESLKKADEKNTAHWPSPHDKRTASQEEARNDLNRYKSKGYMTGRGLGTDVFHPKNDPNIGLQFRNFLDGNGEHQS